MKKNIHLVAGARPNFIKIAPLYHALKRENWADTKIVHTGQHYDYNMSKAFFDDLNLPEPDFHLNAGSGTHAEQTGQVMIAYETVLLKEQPNLVVVVGDINSTMAATLAAAKISYPPNQAPRSTSHPYGSRPFIAHLEAGLRSFDRSMPEEINRIVTDALADILWTPSSDAVENLINEGISSKKIFRVGNIMIDSLEMIRDRIEEHEVFKDYGLIAGEYGVITLHRPSNVDSPQALNKICDALINLSKKLSLIFPVHPRTMKFLKLNGLYDRIGEVSNVIVTEPLHYIPFMNLVFNARMIVTDSGGLQEETTYLGIPCLTLRPNTERPVTINEGTNRLCNEDDLETAVHEILEGKIGEGQIPEFWDGQTAGRVVQTLLRYFDNHGIGS